MNIVRVIFFLYSFSRLVNVRRSTFPFQVHLRSSSRRRQDKVVTSSRTENLKWRGSVDLSL